MKVEQRGERKNKKSKSKIGWLGFLFIYILMYFTSTSKINFEYMLLVRKDLTSCGVDAKT